MAFDEDLAHVPALGGVERIEAEVPKRLFIGVIEPSVFEGLEEIATTADDGGAVNGWRL